MIVVANGFRIKRAELAQGYKVKNKKRLSTLMSNIGQENILLHARALKEFFYYPKEDRYFRAVDYVPNWEEIRPQKGKVVKELQTRVDAEVMHTGKLKKERTYQNKKWAYTALIKELLNLVNIFLKKLDESWKDKPIKKLEKRMPDFRKGWYFYNLKN